jgi:hypothetical protein
MTFRVLGYNTVQQQWTERARLHDEGDARAVAEAMAHRDPRARVRVEPVGPAPVLGVKAPVNNATRAWRIEQAASMSDRKDDRHRYKSN